MMTLSSSAFQHDAVIPEKYGRDFENINPPLMISDVSPNARSLTLIMEDPDIPVSVGVPVWDHWVVFNVSPTASVIPERWIVDGVRGKNSRGELEYGGPRPPDREHRYFFKVYAFDCLLQLDEGATKDEVLQKMGGHVIEIAELVGRFAPREAA